MWKNCHHSCIKMKICHYQGCNDIGIVIATKWRHYLFYFSNNSRHWEPYKIVHRSFFLQYGHLDVREVYAKSVSQSVIEIFWGEGNTVRKGKSWCLAVICRKLSAFDMQFNLIVVLIYLKTCVRDRALHRLLERGIFISTYQGALVSGFVNISVYFTKLANNFKPNDRFFKRIHILLVIQTEN